MLCLIVHASLLPETKAPAFLAQSSGIFIVKNVVVAKACILQM